MRNLLCAKCLATLPDVSFAQRLLSMRIMAGLTQAALAQAAGYSQGLICKLEGGKHQPRPVTSQRLLAFLERALNVPRAPS
jgi:predicted transcriptional regulator